MHYHAELWYPKEPTTEQIEQTLVPYKEERIEDIWTGWWDWWQIGGRFTGAHTDYDPATDPLNWEICPICKGTGLIKGEICNGCGKFNPETRLLENPDVPGLAIKWPTDWVSYSLDICSIDHVKPELSCYSLMICQDMTQIFHRQFWDGESFIATAFDGKVLPKLNELGITTGWLVTIDYHC